MSNFTYPLGRFHETTIRTAEVSLSDAATALRRYIRTGDEKDIVEARELIALSQIGINAVREERHGKAES